MPFLWGHRFGVPSSISGPFVNAMLLLGAAGLGGYSLARLAGNPVRIHMDENGVWRWMSRVEYEHWLLSVAANKARARPSDERALLDLEVRRLQLRAEIAKSEGKAGISMDDLAVRPEDLRATADEESRASGGVEGADNDEDDWAEAEARSGELSQLRA